MVKQFTANSIDRKDILKNFEEGKKSYAVSFKFQDSENTLKDNQVDAIMDKIRTQLEAKLGAQLRG